MVTDNTTLQTTLATPPSGLVVATRAASHAGDSDVDFQVISLVAVTGSEGSRTVREVLITDDAAFTPGTDAVLMIGGEFDDTTPNTLDEGDAGAVRLSSRREMYVQLRDAAGNERGLNVDASGNITVNVTGTVTVGSHAVTNAGTFAVQVDGAALTALQLIDNLVLAEDAAHQTADPGIQMLAVRDDTLNIRSGAENDYEPLHTDANGALWVRHTADTIAVTQSGTWDEVGINDSGNSITVDWAGTAPPIGAGVEATALRVTVATDSTGVLSVDDNGGALTVDNAGTFAVQVDGSALTSLQLIDDPVFADDAAFTLATSKVMVGGAIRDDTLSTLTAVEGDAVPLRVNSTGALHVTGAGGGTQYAVDDALGANPTGTLAVAIRDDALSALTPVEGDAIGLRVGSTGALWVAVEGTVTVGSHAVTNAGTFAVQVDGDALTALQLIDNIIRTEDEASAGGHSGAVVLARRTDTPANQSGTDGDYEFLQMSAGRVWVSATVDAALPAGTNAIGKLAANSGVTIGAVEIAAAQTLATVTTVSTVSALGTGTTGPMKAEDVAHSTGDMGIPAWGVRQDTPNATFAASNDYHFLATDMVGGVRTALYETDFAVLGTNHVKKYYTNAGAVTDGIVWSPAAGKRWYVTDLIVNVSAAATVTFEDDKAGGDEAVMKFELAANSGIVHHFGTPWFSGEDAADLIVTTSAGNIYITVTGYEI